MFALTGDDEATLTEEESPLLDEARTDDDGSFSPVFANTNASASVVLRILSTVLIHFKVFWFAGFLAQESLYSDVHLDLMVVFL